jgi:hypothetical protein
MKGSKNFTISLSEATLPGSGTLDFMVVPQNTKDSVQSEIQLIEADKLDSYQAEDGVLDKSKTSSDDGEYYNVTLNMVLKKGGSKPVKSVQKAALLQAKE